MDIKWSVLGTGTGQVPYAYKVHVCWDMAIICMGAWVHVVVNKIKTLMCTN